MRDTLLLVLAAIGGSVLISVACAAMWVAGTACIDWYDRIIRERDENARAERAAARWGSYVLMTNRHRSDASWFAEGRALLQRGRTDCRKWPSGGRPRGVGRVRERR